MRLPVATHAQLPTRPYAFKGTPRGNPVEGEFGVERIQHPCHC